MWPFSMPCPHSVVHANMVTADAQSHWLMGVSLIAVYLLIAIAYLVQ